MSYELLRPYWALLIASVLGTAIFLFVIYRAYQDSAAGRLQSLAQALRRREQAAKGAAKAVTRLQARLGRMRTKTDSIKPRHAQEATDALLDAQALAKIADDQVLVARNLVRKHILEEYPPKRHAALRDKYLGIEAGQQTPFTMGD